MCDVSVASCVVDRTVGCERAASGLANFLTERLVWAAGMGPGSVAAVAAGLACNLLAACFRVLSDTLRERYVPRCDLCADTSSNHRLSLSSNIACMKSVED